MDITEAEFYETYKPLRDESGSLRLYNPHTSNSVEREMIDTAVTERRLWTYHHGEYNSVYFWNGPHFVNRLDYVICEVPYAENADIITHDPDHSICEECPWCGVYHQDLTENEYDAMWAGERCDAEGCPGETSEEN